MSKLVLILLRAPRKHRKYLEDAVFELCKKRMKGIKREQVFEHFGAASIRRTRIKWWVFPEDVPTILLLIEAFQFIIDNRLDES